MGIVNVTSDSFSGDGVAVDVEAAVATAGRHAAGGADIVDVGGESTRPGFEPVPVEEEIRRVIPAVTAIRSAVTIPISVDTTKAEVAEQALEAGASVINDISGLVSDPHMIEVVAERQCGVIIMHSRCNRRHDDVMHDILDFLSHSLKRAESAGVPAAGMVIDPGFGFAKKPEENLDILRRLGEMVPLGFPVLIGTSRKSTIGKVLGTDVDDRAEGTAAANTIAIANGADIIRVHDSRAGTLVAKMADAVVRGWPADQGPLAACSPGSA
jgi:dihydropteroate synthase